MVDLSAYLDPEDDEPPGGGGGDAEDLAALKVCLKALADALASTNLAVLSSVHGDAAGASGRVKTSVEALKRFSEGYAVLDAGPAAAEDADEDEADSD